MSHTVPLSSFQLTSLILFTFMILSMILVKLLNPWIGWFVVVGFVYLFVYIICILAHDDGTSDDQRWLKFKEKKE